MKEEEDDDNEKEENVNNNNEDIMDDESDNNNNSNNNNSFKMYDLLWYCSKYFGCYPCLKISVNDLPKEIEEKYLNKESNKNNNNKDVNKLKNKSIIMFIYPDVNKYGVVDNVNLFIFDRKFNHKLLCEERDNFILNTITHCYVYILYSIYNLLFIYLLNSIFKRRIEVIE